jgi:hypothetical protein
MRAWTGRIDGETFVFDAIGLGDVDGDGATDTLVTSALSSRAGYAAGRMMVPVGAKP